MGEFIKEWNECENRERIHWYRWILQRRRIYPQRPKNELGNEWENLSKNGMNARIENVFIGIAEYCNHVEYTPAT